MAWSLHKRPGKPGGLSMTATLLTHDQRNALAEAQPAAKPRLAIARPAVTVRPAEQRVAVMVNRNARAVTSKILETLERLVGGRDLFVSQNLGSAQGIARYLAGERYDTILCAGGDGTFSRCVTDVYEAVGRDMSALPAFGVLRLGTGNGVATTLSASPRTEKGLAMDLWRARSAAPAGTLSMLEVEGRLTPFAGFGFDAGNPERPRVIARTLARMGLGFLGTGNHTYAVSVSGISVPRAMVAPRTRVRIRNLGAPAVRMGEQGPTGAIAQAGDILYEGQFGLACASTVPYYGLNFVVPRRQWTAARVSASRLPRPDARGGTPSAGDLAWRIPSRVVRARLHGHPPWLRDSQGGWRRDPNRRRLCRPSADRRNEPCPAVPSRRSRTLFLAAPPIISAKKLAAASIAPVTN